MAQVAAHPLPYVLTGISTMTGTPLPIGEWAQRARIPRQGRSGGCLDGSVVKRVLGIDSKSWDPQLFSSLDVLVELSNEALRSAALAPDDIDTLITVSSTPYEVNLDQDPMRLARRLGLREDVPPLHLSSGCAGVARALALAARLTSERILVVTYTVPSLAAGDGQGGINDLYRHNTVHPFGSSIWTSPGLFSDGAAAFVLSRTTEGGTVLYSRECDTFPENPLIHYLGGGVEHPPGTPGAAELAAYGLDGPALAYFYSEGMRANHRDLESCAPAYQEQVKRIYTHQATPALVDAYHLSAGLSEDKAPTNVRQYGNLVAVATLRMLHEDLDSGAVKNGDQICLSVVGAGPERGAALLTVDAQTAVRPWSGQGAAE